MGIKSTVNRTLLTLLFSLTSLCTGCSAAEKRISFSNIAGQVEFQAATETRIENVAFKDLDSDWKPAINMPLYLGNTQANIWIRFHLSPQQHSPSDLILYVNWPLISDIEMYIIQGDTSGANPVSPKKHLSSHRPLPAYFPFVFNLKIRPGSDAMVFLRLRSSTKVLVPIEIWDKGAFDQRTRTYNLMLGLFFGILIAMCCYNTSLIIFTRDISYLYYVIYVISIILYTLFFSGTGHVYLWPDSAWIKAHGFGLFSSFSFFAAVIFIRRILKLNKIGGWLLWVSNITALHWIMMMAWYAADHGSLAVTFEDIGAFITCIAGLVTSAYLWFRGNVTAKYITIAWSFLILSTMLLMLGLTGIIAYTPIVHNTQYFGFAVEVVLLSIILADRINRERIKKQAAQALSKRLSVLSQTDALTGLDNRRKFDESLDKEFNRAVRYNHPVALIIADIDHFKTINDTYGHQAGDECLKRFGQVLRAHARRAGDLVSRYGGEEFAVILPQDRVDDAAATAERMRQQIADTVVATTGGPVSMTASFGVAGMTPQQDQTSVTLVKAADDALYTAKNQGRNQVVTSRTEHTQQGTLS